VRVANLLNGQCESIVSIEGNLTAGDAYLTGQAANYDNPIEFKSGLVARVRQLVAAGQAPANYAESLATADARTLWLFGRDVARQGLDDGFGREFVHAPSPTLYLWSRTTTPEATRSFVQRLTGSRQELGIGHHWPWIVDAAVLAGIISGFVLRPYQRSTHTDEAARTRARRRGQNQRAGLRACTRSMVAALIPCASTTSNPAARTRGRGRRVRYAPAARTETCSMSRWAACSRATARVAGLSSTAVTVTSVE